MVPVTAADQAAEAVILPPSPPRPGNSGDRRGKCRRRPFRKSPGTFWLIDPLDGTKEFIKNGDFTVNIG